MKRRKYSNRQAGQKSETNYQPAVKVLRDKQEDRLIIGR